MAPGSFTQRAEAYGTLLLTAAGTVSALPGNANAADGRRQPMLQKRAIMKGNNYISLGNTTIPLTPLLLIFCALGFALLALIYSLINLLCTSSRLTRAGRRVDEERARARQDLRVRGGNRSALSPGGSPTPGSSSSLESGSRKLPPNKISKRVGGGAGTPREGGGGGRRDRRLSRGYRGTSFSLADAGKKGDKAKLGAVGLPVLTAGGMASGSSFQYSPMDLETGEQARKPLLVVVSKQASSLAQQGRGLSNGSSSTGGSGSTSSGGGGRVPPFGTRHVHRTRSSVGLGADLHRSRNSVFGSIPVKPSAMDRTYATPEYGHPLDHSHDLRRHITDPTGGPGVLSSSRRNSSYSIYDNAGSETHSFNDSLANSRMGSFSLATSNPLQALSYPQFGHGSIGSLAGQLGSGASSPRHTGYATPTGGASAGLAADVRAVTDGRYSARNKASYDSDENDAITAQSGLLSWSGAGKAQAGSQSAGRI